MRPGQLEPNELESAILERIADQDHSIAYSLRNLRVLSREFTGVGSFTKFVCQAEGGASRRPIPLDASIRVPTIRNGMGAVLFCKGDAPECLELFTYGGEHWDGVYDGFSIASTV